MLDFFAALHWASILQIVVIDILLGGDNAVVIALACRRLAPAQRRQGVIWGTLGAVLLRLLLAAVAVSLLNLPYLKLIGGLLLFWIGAQLLRPDPEAAERIEPAAQLLGAIRTIIVADLVMSIDNVLAIAGAASAADPRQRIWLIAFGLAVSIPLVIGGSQLVLRLIDRFPLLVAAGAALLGWIGGGMIATDPALRDALAYAPPRILPHAHTVAALAGAGLVLLGGWTLKRIKRPGQAG